jgi:hypothetical protein
MTSEGAAGVTQAALGKHARVPVFLMILAVCSLIALILIDATPFDTEVGYTLFVLPSLVVVWAVIGVWSAALYIRYARRGARKQSRLPGVLVVASILLAFNFFPLVRGCNYLGGALRFSLTRSYYEQQIALLPVGDKPRLAVFIWGGMIWASRGVVYDESDEIAMPPGQQSALWKDKARGGELSCGNWDARRLWSHYYLVGFSC